MFNKLIRLALSLFLLSAQASFADLIFPSNLINKRGHSTPQPLEVLSTLELQNSDDNWNSYIEFETGKTGYQGVFTFTLPANPDENIRTLTFYANYRGPEQSFQKWDFKLLNIQSGRWSYLTGNRDAKDWIWSDIRKKIINSDQYINSHGQIKLLYSTRSGVDNSLLDFLALDISESPLDRFGLNPDSSGLDNSTITVTKTGTRWQPKPGIKWHIQYDGKIDKSLNVDAYDIDMFDVRISDISTLHSKGKHVICYLSAGSYENWRSDAKKFPPSVLGRNLNGWSGEKWLDIRKINILLPIMRTRIQEAARKGCDAIDPDNINSYMNNTGFPLTYSDQLIYNMALAEEAHKNGLAIGLKNDLNQIKDLVEFFDFAVNEECYQFNECDKLKPFIEQEKAVLGIEYNLNNSSFCPKANSSNFDFQKKRLALDAWNIPCR